MRGISSEEIVRRWREKVGAVPGANKLEFKSSIMNTGKPIHVRLAHPKTETLAAAGAELEDWLRSRQGTIDISNTLVEGKRELRLRIKPEAEALGLRQVDLARQVRQAYYGDEAQRVQRGRDDLRVMVRYSEAERRTLASLEAMHIRTAAGAEVPLRTVADLEWGRGPATITRFNRKRSMDVLADVDPAQGGSEARIKAAMEAEVLPRLVRHYPGLSWSYEGGAAEQASFMSGMIVQGFFSLILIFALLAIPLRSYLQPIIIMSVIPFGVTGAIWGHVIMGAEFSMMSFIGLIALTGIVVNDSLVLVDFVNRFREEGLGTASDAIHQAGIARFRPILLTSLTTFAGLLPLMFETDMQAQFLIPAAISLAFGVLFATTIALVLVPCLYLVLEDARRVLGSFSRFMMALGIPRTRGGGVGGSELIQRFLAEGPYAVVGASKDRAKYGNKVLRVYQQHGLEVYPVHPKEEEIEGLEAWPSLTDLPTLPRGVSVVTPPAVTLKVVEEAAALGVPYVWMQPGAESPEAVARATELGLGVISGGPCILVALGFKE
ncbi:MAG: efflux RND transporter permease subunit [Planctomycetota bacterium]